MREARMILLEEGLLTARTEYMIETKRKARRYCPYLSLREFGRLNGAEGRKTRHRLVAARDN